MEPDAQKIFKTLNLNKIWLPIALGVGAVGYFLISDEQFDWVSLRRVWQADWRYFLLSILAVVMRDLGYIARLRVMTHRDLSWLSCFYVIILWEFSASVTPSVVGGGVVAIFLLLKEGVSLGKSLAYVIVASVFDNLFFMAAASLSFLGAYDAAFTEMATLEVKLDTGLKWVFWSSYTFTALYTLIMLLAIFVRPQFFRWALLKLTSIRLLKRWQPVARQHGDEMILASQALQGERWRYWLDVGLATLVAWSARYLVLNLIVASYLSLDFITNLSILGKQVIMWTVMLVSPTPGSSGTAEFFYKQLYGNTLGDYTLITGVLWRLLTNYFYLTLGAIFLPRWIKRIFATPQRLQPCEIGKA